MSFYFHVLTINRDIKIEGRWAGLYTYPVRRPEDGRSTDGESDFTVSASPTADVTKIHGRGYDSVGSFNLEGHVVGHTVRFTKKYASHQWVYRGTIDPQTNTMFGKWGEGQAGGNGNFAFYLVDTDVEGFGSGFIE